ncbi:MAG: hypothetical protein OES32_15470 [Acidobacteriota bacterium]|nr:hypothetical protein [Acidobacteriota bacterium]MDH3524979.1 hypothetical protein [Acidobacteriota bacterium]
MRLRSVWCGAVGALTMLSCGSAEEPAPAPPAPPSRPAVAEPARTDVRLSPDGSWLAFLAAAEGGPGLWLAPAGDPGAARLVAGPGSPAAAEGDGDPGAESGGALSAADGAGRVTAFRWAYSGPRLLYVAASGGVPRLFAVAAAGGASRPLTPAGRPARLVHLSPSRPGQAVVELGVELGGGHREKGEDGAAGEDAAPGETGDPASGEGRGGEGAGVRGSGAGASDAAAAAAIRDLYLLDLDSGALELIVVNDRFSDWGVDGDLDLRLAFETAAGGVRVSQRGETGEWVDFSWIPAEEKGRTRFLGFDGGAGVAYFLDGRGRDRVALVGSHVISGRAEVVFQDPAGDVGEVLFHPLRATPQAAAAGRNGRQRWLLLDEEVRGDLARLRALGAGDLEIVDRALDDRRWLVALVPWDGPRRFYLYDREAGTAELLFGGRGHLLAAAGEDGSEGAPKRRVSSP